MRIRKRSILKPVARRNTPRIELDPTDLEIIRLLQDGGRTTNIEIARAIGVAEGTVRRRIERLVVRGIMKVVAVLDPAKLGYMTDAIIGVSTERTAMLKVGSSLAKLPEVVYVSYTTGVYDIIIEVLFRSDRDLFRFLTETLSKVDGIRSSVTFHVLRTAKRYYDWKLPLHHSI
jgi:Lrp/AsnC family transcriptional regulator for asnA, asnC and gidA